VDTAGATLSATSAFFQVVEVSSELTYPENGGLRESTVVERTGLYRGNLLLTRWASASIGIR
jgi:hypothetical protein